VVTARVVPVIWGNQEAVYFFARDWTGSITLMRLVKLSYSRIIVALRQAPLPRCGSGQAHQHLAAMFDKRKHHLRADTANVAGVALRAMLIAFFAADISFISFDNFPSDAAPVGKLQFTHRFADAVR
jgi:hypothetical protein